MSHLAIAAAYGDFASPAMHRFKSVLRRVEARVGDAQDVERLSLSSEGHLYARTGAIDRQQASLGTEQRSLLVGTDELVINPMWLTGGSIAVSDKRGAVSPDYRVFVPDQRLVYPRFLHHLLRSRPYRDQYDLFVRANTTFDRRIQQEDLDRLPIWLPAMAVQLRIADFLDNHVARLDQMIGVRRRQVDGAREIVSTAITDATTPPSEMNSKWRLARFGHIAKVNDGLVDPRETPFASMPLVAPNHIEKRTGRLLELTSAREQGAESGKGYVRAGQVIYSKIRPALRKATIAPTDVLCSADAYGLQANVALITPPFLLASVLGDFFSQQAVEASDRVAMPKINRDTLAEMRIWLPPIEVQNDATHRVGKIQMEVEGVAAGLESSIELLAEYKQSLITAAVTGELDVRTAGSGIPG